VPRFGEVIVKLTALLFLLIAVPSSAQLPRARGDVVIRYHLSMRAHTETGVPLRIASRGPQQTYVVDSVRTVDGARR
jgi:hypothetical protein